MDHSHPTSDTCNSSPAMLPSDWPSLSSLHYTWIFTFDPHSFSSGEGARFFCGSRFPHPSSTPFLEFSKG